MRDETTVIIATSQNEREAAVHDDAGSAIGTVGALVPTVSGHIAFVVINLEMPDRTDGKQVVVPITAFTRSDSGALTLPGASFEKLHSMPEFAEASALAQPHGEIHEPRRLPSND